MIRYYKMGKRVRISNERVNSYGTRVLTSGLDVSQYEKNPVLLWMHRRGEVIGLVKDLKVEGDEVTGELVFDEATELSVRLKKQWEFGSLKMVSAGIDVIELSEDAENLTLGQTRATISKSKLFEVSLVDIGSNDDAIVLKKDGQTIELGKDGDCVLPLLHIEREPKSGTEMELKTLALQLGLPETADEAAVKDQLAALQLAKQEVETLKKEKAALELQHLMGVVDTAIKEKRIGAERRDHFAELGKKIGAEELENLFEAMQPQVKLSALLPGNDAGKAPQGQGWKKLSDVPAGELLKLRKEQPEEYRRLYEAEYGMGCEY